MFAVFCKSLFFHLGWWLASLWPGRHEGAPLGLRRLIFLLLGYPAFLALQSIHWIGFLLDEIFFSAYRRVEIETPVFIVGIPRSGTTFLHRTLATVEGYTSLNTWEALLAPSITERKLIRFLAALDRAIGAPSQRLIHWAFRKGSSDFNAIHEVGLEAPEEDYLTLLPVGHCFILSLAFPFSKKLSDLAQLDQLPENERRAIVQFYKRCLQKHLYCHPGKRLLSKNAAFSSWTADLQAAFPKAKFLVSIREPDTALSSQLSSLAPARQLFGADPDGQHTAARFTQHYAHAYQNLAQFVEDSDLGQVAVIAQSELKQSPARTIRTALEKTGLAIPAGLEALQPSPSSKHHHQPDGHSTDHEKIKHCMRPAYEAMLRSR
ncbi:MAG: sulfotransferase [Verrucomicrobiota bacterium]